MSERASPKKVASRNGLIFLAFGVFGIFEKALILGLILLILGFITYFVLILMERKLKLL